MNRHISVSLLETFRINGCKDADCHHQKEKFKAIRITLYFIEDSFAEGTLKDVSPKKHCLLQETEALNASTCKYRKVCMHTEIGKEKTPSSEDSTVKLIHLCFY